MVARPNINFRYFVFPSIDIGPISSDALNMSGEYTKPMVELGKKDGKSHVEAGAGKHFSLLKEYMAQTELPSVYEFSKFVESK